MYVCGLRISEAVSLPPQQVDMLIDAGRDALKGNSTFRAFLGSLGRAPWRSTPVAMLAPSTIPIPLEASAQAQ